MPQKILPHDHGQPIERELEHMPGVEAFQIVSDIFKQLGDGSRIRIFWLLCHCEECVINISAWVDMSSPAVSHHLQVLKEAGVVKARKEGTRIYYDLDPRDSEIENMVRLFADIRQIMRNAPDRSGED